MKYILKIWWTDEDNENADVRLMSEAELVKWFDMSDCYPAFDYEAFAVDLTKKEFPYQIWYRGWQPNCLIEFVDIFNEVAASGYGTDH